MSSEEKNQTKQLDGISQFYNYSYIKVGEIFMTVINNTNCTKKRITVSSIIEITQYEFVLVV